MSSPNILQVPYLLYRLSPIFIVGIFTSLLIFKNSIGSLFYFIGLLITYFTIHVILLYTPKYADDTSNKNNTMMCEISKIGGSVPISLCILCYSFLYLVYSIIVNNVVIYNISTIFMFVSLIIADFMYNCIHSCYGLYPLGLTIFISGGLGALFSYLLGLGNVNGNEHLINTVNNSRLIKGEIVPYKCDIYNDSGRLIPNNKVTQCLNK